MIGGELRFIFSENLFCRRFSKKSEDLAEISNFSEKNKTTKNFKFSLFFFIKYEENCLSNNYSMNSPSQSMTDFLEVSSHVETGS